MGITTQVVKGSLCALFLTVASSPANASWLCFSNGDGCYEFENGICGSSNVQNFAERNGMVCLGSVRIKDDVGRMEDLLAKAQTTPGGKRRLGKLKIAAREFKK